MPRYNLIEEPWIPVQTPHGSATVSLRAALLNAPNFTEVLDESPLVTASLYRLLLAVLHAAYRGPRDEDAWIAMWKADGFDIARVGGYLDEQRVNFELFNDQRPFYQRTDMECVSGPSSALRLVHDSGAIKSQEFWNHTASDGRALSPAEAARALIATQSYAFSGGQSCPIRFYDAPHIRGMTLLARSSGPAPEDQNLFRTLLLNLLIYDDLRPFASSPDDAPVWEIAEAREPRTEGTAPNGYLDLLTWQGRAIRLLPEADGSVRQCLFRMNLILDDREGRDPFKAYRIDDKLGPRPMSFSEDRAVWRDSHALFVGGDGGEKRRRPTLLNHLDQIRVWRGAGVVKSQPRYAVDVLGACTKRGDAVILYWRHERLPLPLEYLNSKALQEALGAALQAAEKAAYALEQATLYFARLLLQPATPDQATKKSQPKPVTDLANSFSTSLRYWRQLDLKFGRMLDTLADDFEEIDEVREYGYGPLRVLPGWASDIRIAARDALRAATNSLATSERSYRASAEASQWLERRLARAVRPMAVTTIGSAPAPGGTN